MVEIGFITCCFHLSWHWMLGHGVMLSTVLQSIDSPTLLLHVCARLCMSVHSTLPLTFWPLTCCPHLVCNILLLPCPSSCPHCEVLREGHFRDCGGGSDHLALSEKMLDEARQTDAWGSERYQLMSYGLTDACHIQLLQLSSHPPSILHLFLCPCPPVSLTRSHSSSSVSLTLCVRRIKHGWLSLSLTEQPWLRERERE